MQLVFEDEIFVGFFTEIDILIDLVYGAFIFYEIIYTYSVKPQQNCMMLPLNCIIVNVFSDLLVKERCVLLEQLIHVLIVHLIIEVVTRIDKYPYYVMNVVQ